MLQPYDGKMELNSGRTQILFLFIFFFNKKDSMSLYKKKKRKEESTKIFV